MWPDIIKKSKEGDIIKKSKEGGLDVIKTYVFWNYHEPVKGKKEMKLFLAKIVGLMKDENLFASQGGPIILAQVENEYGNVEGSYGVGGELYVKWAAETAVNLNMTVPWVMCAQHDAPDPIINTCNGFYCVWFSPNSPSKPKMWTENYNGCVLAFGNAIPYRPVEDLAFAVAWFFETGGTFQNYYMYFGGTNFGRMAGGPLVATSYDYDAPIDEYGFGYGNHEDESFNLTKKITFHHGNNTLDVLSMMIGLQVYKFSSLHNITLTNILHISIIFSVGLEGEYLGLGKISLANSSLWTRGTALPVNHSLIWYKVIFLAPEGKGPLALNLASMGKGQAWVNGQSIGRYWTAYLSPSTGCTNNCDYRGTYDPYKCLKDCGQPAQTLYHIPRTWVHPGENLLVLHEELGGDPSKISLLTRTGQEICAHVSEADPPPADSWKPNKVFNSQIPEVRLNCEQGWHINIINFASFGTPRGNCGTFTPGICHVNMTSIVQQVKKLLLVHIQRDNE
ncbi:hypothetical protein SO802_007806 [Lithocarpus litseifolius]|uniref:beta-galactosidase n=1 Tax=Lithocarpus litseifolius TaxID=425828 RepID=A0AAW2DT19_9ROSI